MIRRVAIVCKGNNERTHGSVQKLINEFCKRRIEINMFRHDGDEEVKYKGDMIGKPFLSLSELTPLPNIIFSVGGDGTFLETATVVGDSGIPIVGVNTGRMGFLANTPNEGIDNTVDLLCNGEFDIINRSLLEVVRPSHLFGNNRALALNEVTVQKSSFSMINIHVYVNNIFLNTYWADGLIISTATGSTAYNLSVGGPILYPDDESIVISPISPHNLTVRPIVLSGKNDLRLVLDGRVDGFLATCDYRSERMDINEEIHIKSPDYKLKTIMLKETNFFNTLRNRLMWGMDKRN